MKKRVLFVCIHNSARSQMAEELLRKLAGEHFEVESAGLEPGKLNPLVVKVLQQIGIDIEGKKTKSVASLIKSNQRYDYVITVCDEASAERCPVFPGNHQRLHWSFPDPSQFQGTDEEKCLKITEVLRNIAAKINEFLENS